MTAVIAVLERILIFVIFMEVPRPDVVIVLVALIICTGLVRQGDRI